MRKFLVVLLADLMLLLPLWTNVLYAQADPSDAGPSVHIPVKVAPVVVADSLRGDYVRGLMQGGEWAAYRHNSDGWGFGGFAGGLCLGIIGGGLVLAASTGGNTMPPPDVMMKLADKPTQFQTGFLLGYAEKSHSANITSALWGGLGGTAVAVVVVMVVVSSKHRR